VYFPEFLFINKHCPFAMAFVLDDTCFIVYCWSSLMMVISLILRLADTVFATASAAPLFMLGQIKREGIYHPPVAAVTVAYPKVTFCTTAISTSRVLLA
jgi:hypothetical protein